VHTHTCSAPNRALAANVLPGRVYPRDEVAYALILSVVVAPDDVPAEHAALLQVGGMFGTVRGEIRQGGEPGERRTPGPAVAEPIHRLRELARVPVSAACGAVFS